MYIFFSFQNLRGLWSFTKQMISFKFGSLCVFNGDTKIQIILKLKSEVRAIIIYIT